MANGIDTFSPHLGSRSIGLSDIKLSIVIVNYKVKEYVSNLLSSIRKAQGDLAIQVFVVDNDSGDGSIDYLRNRHPDVSYIQNHENVGFGKANNQAIQKARGTYTLIINPDTLVSEDTFGMGILWRVSLREK